MKFITEIGKIELGDLLQLLSKESVLLSSYGSSFESKGFVTYPRFKLDLEKIYKNFIFIKLLDENNKLIGFHALVENWDCYKDIPSYEHKYRYLKRIEDNLNNGYKIIHMDLIFLKKEYRGQRLSKKLFKFGKIYRNSSKKKYLFVGFINPYNSYAIRIAGEKLGSRFLLNSEYPVLFQYKFDNNPYFGSSSVSMVPHLFVYSSDRKNTKDKSYKKKRKDDYRIILKWKGKGTKSIFKDNSDLILADVSIPKPLLESNKNRYWLIDKVVAYLLTTSSFAHSRKRREVILDDYNDFTVPEKNEVYSEIDKNLKSEMIERLKTEIKNSETEKVCDLGGIKGKWGKKNEKKIKRINVENGNTESCIELYNLETLEKQLRDCSTIIMKHLLCRLYNYKNKQDYSLEAKTLFFDYMIRLLLVQNKRLYIGYTEVDAVGRGLDIKEIGDIFNRFLERNKAKIKGKIYDKVYLEKDKWVAFWWYALVDNLFTNKNIENVLNYYGNLLNIIKRETNDEKHYIRNKP